MYFQFIIKDFLKHLKSSVYDHLSNKQLLKSYVIYQLHCLGLKSSELETLGEKGINSDGGKLFSIV